MFYLLGSGKFGKVYFSLSHDAYLRHQKGIHVGVGEMMACKVIPIKESLDYMEVEKEIEMLRMLDHPNTVGLKDVSKTKSNYYIFLEYCSEGDLKKFIKTFNRFHGKDSCTLDEKDARYIIKKIVEGLNYLGQRQIMHRDIKLENIIVNRKENVPGTHVQDFEFKLGDMGLATSLRKSRNAMADTFAGTPLAMAPELINGDKYSYKADVWSLGTLLFQMLTGEHPFNGRNMEELKLKL